MTPQLMHTYAPLLINILSTFTMTMRSHRDNVVHAATVEDMECRMIQDLPTQLRPYFTQF
jgi:hypothetical protein